MRRVLPAEMAGEVGALSPDAIAEVRADVWPAPRDPDELHDLLQSVIALPENHPNGRQANEVAQGFSPAFASSGGSALAAEGEAAEWMPLFQCLARERRAGRAVYRERAFWFSAERAAEFRALYPEAQIEIAPGEVAGSSHDQPMREDALLTAVNGWMQHIGPATAASLAATLGLDSSDIEKALLRLEAAGSVLRGQFENRVSQLPIEFCDRRLLARIHRLTLGRLRKQIEPVATAQFMRWLLRWQHLEPGSQLAGERGLLEVLRQMQGFEIPANAWERHILAPRLRDYDPKLLDQLCLTGAVGWGRLSPHPATLEPTGEGDGQRRVIPTKVAPIPFFVREHADWLDNVRTPLEPDSRALSAAAREVHDFLQRRGASFFADIVRGTSRLKAEVETGLWELVAAGLVTADGFDNLRSLIDSKRRSGHGSGRTARPRPSAGRSALLRLAEALQPK